ncbi:uncharacterized protein LOC127805981 isoform X14 [Diospyros lotus]|uniref:uncharacterized protein LOC127805981 isoform X14 n=1 Tax=Diospyros lotus TaxID=55363 RepID=UPI00224F14FA|nr:uncharacterized protein LOC127805981 isoform X14 [Diospyros lotus]
MYLCWRKRRGFSRELVFKEEIDRKLCAFGNYWLVLKGTIFRLSGITAYSSFQVAEMKSSQKTHLISYCMEHRLWHDADSHQLQNF